MVDVDGVLVHANSEDGRSWFTRLHEDLQISPDDLYEKFFAPHWNEIVTGQAGLLERLEPVLAEIAPRISSSDFLAYWFGQDARVDTTLLAEFQRYRAMGLKMHLATNQEHLRAAYLLETLGLSAHVDRVHYSAAVGHRKPDRGFFDTVAASVDLAPENLILIDDTLPNVEAARDAGWHAVHWTGEDPLADVLAPYL
ncbi:haloacid dehalogenase [Mesorhizobium soli]|uniref:Haloacid dehalogenase n=2 Tax=Pseudaminobacter soli (ex Li et al. 2025) TaxID=1295366 RepID=A0A2P7SAF5_9HYPH|nr:haloacid dehalogenase [Mesorhizobium soli]